MRFDVVTLFPELFEPFLKAGVTRRAYESGQVQVRLWQLRDFAEGNYRRVDDRPFGGGPGMVMLADRLAAHRFACTAKGYPDWQWEVSVARMPRGPRLRHVRSRVSSFTIAGDMFLFT